MTIQNFYLDRLDYKKKLKSAIFQLGAEGMEVSGFPTADIFYIKRTGVTIVYDSKKGIIIAAKNRGEVRKAQSKLEKISGVKLTEF
jgi:hypothetical protein